MISRMAETVPRPVVTPLLRDGGVWVKAEGRQRTGTVKYRLVASRVLAALARGEIAGGKTLIEATSGSTGVALAWVGRGILLPVELHVYEGASPEKLARMRDLGATVLVHRAAEPIGALLAEVRRRAASGTAWHLGQYGRDAGREAYDALGQEVVLQVREAGGPPPRVFACPVGTGGLIQGVGRVLRDAFPGIRIVAVEPAEGVSIDGMRPFTRVSMGADDPFDPSFPNEVAVIDAPPPPTSVQGVAVGASAAATLALVRSRGWADALVIAAE